MALKDMIRKIDKKLDQVLSTQGKGDYLFEKAGMESCVDKSCKNGHSQYFLFCSLIETLLFVRVLSTA